MRFGLALPQYDFSLPAQDKVSWDSLRDWAIRAEKLGFDSIWGSDHVIWDISKYGGPQEPQGVFECFTALAALATVTNRIRIGSLVVCNDLRPPAMVAKMAASIDVLSAGRLDLGMGAGWYEPEFTSAGLPFREPAVRVSRLSEAIQIVRGMLEPREEAFSFEGDHYRVTEAWNLPSPVQRPSVPIWVGGKGDQIVRIAARHADGYNLVWAITPRTFTSRVELLERTAEEAGRDPESIKKSVGLYVLPGNTRREIEDGWRRYVEASPPGVSAGVDPFDWGADKLMGSGGQMRERIEAFGELGVEEVILGFGLLPFQIADERAVELFSKEVIS